MGDQVFTPPPGAKIKNVPSRRDLLKVIAVLKKEMSFTIRPKRHTGLERILDKNGEEVGHLAYDLLRYFVRACALASIISRDGIESLKESIRTQCRDFELNYEFFEWLMASKIGNKLVSEYLWRGFTTAIDSGMRKVINALVEPSTANIGRFLPTDVISVHRSAKDKAIFNAVSKLFMRSLNLPAACIVNGNVDPSAFEPAVENLTTCGIFRSFFDEMTAAKL
jgi:hypothetical protein